MSYETIDLDKADRDTLRKVLAKIEGRGCKVLKVRISPSMNGYHVEVVCRCGACRLVFDDPERLARDLCRPVFSQNVLFDVRRRKTYLDRFVELSHQDADRDGLPSLR